MRRAIGGLPGAFDRHRLTTVWNEALACAWALEPVWVHGDFEPANLLPSAGALSGVIDFVMLGVGDPACDLVIAWTFLTQPTRAAFRRCLELDAATWRRARGWAAWKAAILLSGETPGSARAVAEAAPILIAILGDYSSGGDA